MNHTESGGSDRKKRSLGMVAVAAAVALALGACSGSGDDVDGDDSGEAPSAASDATATDSDDQDRGGASPSGEPVRIGVVTSLTGPFTPWGVQARAGMQMAVDELNDGGGIDGRPVELVEGDDENNPEVGVAQFERMVEQDGVVAAGGVISSDVGLAMGLAAEELEVPVFMVKAGAAEILTPDSRYTFRTCLPSAPMTADPLIQYAQENDLSRIGAIIADYAWGQSWRAAIDAAVSNADGIDLQLEVAPVGETDFTTYLRSLEDFDPDVIAATGHPPGTPAITLQATDLGFDAPVSGPYSPLATVFEGVGEAAYDRYSDYGCADYSSDDYQELAARFAEESEFGFMEDDAVAGYGMVMAIGEAVTEVGDDPGAVAEYLHDNEFDMPGYSHTLSWTEWGELAASQPALAIIREQEPPEGINPGATWYPEVLLVSDPLDPHVPD